MRRMMMIGLAMTAGLIFLCAAVSHAHGVGYRHSELGAVVLEFFYSTGEKMSYREARVYSPKDSKFAAQTGRTDEQGRFAFIPDTSGEWRVIVRDEEGHQCEAIVSISETLSASVSGDSSGYSVSDLWLRAVLGVSILFNIAMIIRWRSIHAH
ncbi:MAG: hypothetical protein IJS39_11560 [Synergistaceae bacterium]|nr:hypothetical protein [Synergistaceae bacterium]